jgi:hypothetical protein
MKIVPINARLRECQQGSNLYEELQLFQEYFMDINPKGK